MANAKAINQKSESFAECVCVCVVTREKTNEQRKKKMQEEPNREL